MIFQHLNPKNFGKISQNNKNIKQTYDNERGVITKIKDKSCNLRNSKKKLSLLSIIIEDD